MKFFQKLSELGITDLIIQFQKETNGEVTVFVAPKIISKYNSLKSLKPIKMNAIAEHLDFSFFTTLEPHLVEVVKAIKEEEEELKAQKIKALSDAQPKVVPTKKVIEHIKKVEENNKITETIKINTEVDKNSTEPIEKIPKVNNEKVLKDFVATIKDQDIILHKDKLEELLSNFSIAEFMKPYPKKIRMDLDIRLRKEANIQAAREKFGFSKKEEPIDKEIDVVEPMIVETENTKKLSYIFPKEFDSEEDDKLTEEQQMIIDQYNQ